MTDEVSFDNLMKIPDGFSLNPESDVSTRLDAPQTAKYEVSQELKSTHPVINILSL